VGRKERREREGGDEGRKERDGRGTNRKRRRKGERIRSNQKEKMAAIVQQGMHIEATGTRVSVPNNNIARLMYYLSCLNSCIDFIPEEATQYSKYHLLSEGDKASIVALCVLVSPDLLLGKVLFPVPPGSPLLNGSSNEFYKITEASRILAADQVGDDVVVIDGKRVKVTKFMVLSETWLMNHYINPLKAEIGRLNGGQGENRPLLAPASYVREDDLPIPHCLHLVLTILTGGCWFTSLFFIPVFCLLLGWSIFLL